MVERKNRTLEEIARTILCESQLSEYFWVETVNTACYILNRVLVRPILKKILYELQNNRKPNIIYFHVFDCRCFIHNNGKDNLHKFDAKSDEDIFLEYSTSSKTYWIFNKSSLIVEELIYVMFDESNSNKPKDKEDEEEINDKIEKLNLNENTNQDEPKKIKKKKLKKLKIIFKRLILVY